MRRLFGAVDASRQRPVQLDADTLRALLPLLYGAGLRFGEAQRLAFDDVDLDGGALTVRDTKLFKSRVVPVAPKLADALRDHAARRAERPLPKGAAATFLANRDGTPLAKATARDAFLKLLDAAGIRHDGRDGRRAPRLHSLRHAAAVHRLEDWYRQGADMQRLLPALSTWLGHASLDTTNVHAEIDIETKARAMALCDAAEPGPDRPWREDRGVMAFLGAL